MSKITASQEKELKKIVKKMKIEKIDHFIIKEGTKAALYSDELFDLFDYWNNEISEEVKSETISDIVSELKMSKVS